MPVTPYNEHMRLAQAMIHGHLYIDPAPSWMEHIHVNGHDYILHPPLSAILCVPFAMLGISDQGIPSIILGGLSVVLVYLLTRSGWLTAFFLFGTTFLYEATLGASWNFALVASTPFTFAAIILTGRYNESQNQRTDQRSARNSSNVRRDGIYLRNESLVGLFAGLAALARYDLVLAWPVYLWVIWRRSDDSTYVRLGLVTRFLCGPALVGAIYIWFNEARFGTLTDGSINEWFWHYDALRAQRPYGPFSIHYMPFNLFTLLWMGPSYQGGFPWLRPQYMGQALLSLSPAFLLANISPWLMAAILASIPAVTVYASGFSQLGCRYYVQVVPFLVATMVPNAESAGLSTSAKALICASILLSMSATTIVWIWGLA